MPNIIPVSALNTYVKSLLESDQFLVDIAIKGEISNFNRNYKSGHCYFSLKDETASVKAVMFRSDAQRLAFSPENGMSVLARCRVSLYERDGAFQLYVTDLFPDGVGAAQMAFEQLKARLNAEGLFLEEHKKTLPAYPTCVGLVTSKTGAALQDILKVAHRRNPGIRFKLVPVMVQGDNAAAGIARAIARLDADEDVEVIIVARGGGSAEDLWVFNAEAIARAAFTADTPIVSAIGHEVDFTILDFVADLRAPTPSAAAELVLPDMHLARREMVNLFMHIAKNMHDKYDICYNSYKRARVHPALEKTARLPQAQRQKLIATGNELRTLEQRRLVTLRQQLQASIKLAAGLNPYAVLARGYAVPSLPNGQMLRSVGEIEAGERLNLTLQDGTLGCTVQSVTPKQPMKTENNNGKAEA